VTPHFTINFRREVYRQQLARTRRRMLSVGVWMAYFGVLVIVLGLYDLNCASLAQRTRLLEAQNRRLSATGRATAWKPGDTEILLVERALANPQVWSARLARLAAVLPPGVALTSVAANPGNLDSGSNQDKLLFGGTLRPQPGQDAMQGIMTLVSTLRADSVFAAQYRSIRLVESRIGSAGAPVEFQIECHR
jgi:hypothetical protein